MKIWSFVLINNKFFNNVKSHTKYLLIYNDLLCPFLCYYQQLISLFKPHELNSLNINCIRIDCSSSRCSKIKITPTSNYMVCNKLVYSLYRIYLHIFYAFLQSTFIFCNTKSNFEEKSHRKLTIICSIITKIISILRSETIIFLWIKIRSIIKAQNESHF